MYKHQRLKDLVIVRLDEIKPPWPEEDHIKYIILLLFFAEEHEWREHVEVCAKYRGVDISSVDIMAQELIESGCLYKMTDLDNLPKTRITPWVHPNTKTAV